MPKFAFPLLFCLLNVEVIQGCTDSKVWLSEEFYKTCDYETIFVNISCREKSCAKCCHFV